MVRRITTNGMMRSYKTNLMRSYNNLAGITEKVTTQRNFNSYAESPSKANQAFQLRRNRWNTENQISNSKQIVQKFRQGWKCLEASYQDLGVKLAKYSKLRADNEADAGGRKALGEVIKGTAESLMETMNAKYGENFIFSGADGQNVPFEWSTDDPPEVLYRGMKVDVLTPTEAELKAGNWQDIKVQKLDADGNPVLDHAGNPVMVKKYEDYEKIYNTIENEHTYVDLGMGMKETPGTPGGAPGQLIESSALDSALPGAKMMGYGYQTVTLNSGKEVTVPNNIISIVNQMGEILSNCSAEDGAYPEGNYAIKGTGEDVSAEEMSEALERPWRTLWMSCTQTLWSLIQKLHLSTLTSFV